MAASGFVHQPLVDQGPPSLWTQPPGRRSDLGRPPLQEGHRPRVTTLTSAQRRTTPGRRGEQQGALWDTGGGLRLSPQRRAAEGLALF